MLNSANTKKVNKGIKGQEKFSLLQNVGVKL